jgi:UDP-glucose 4-epimerase
MRILVTGATGFIGSQIVKSLIKKFGNNSVVILSSKNFAGLTCFEYHNMQDFGTEATSFDDITHVIHAGAFIPKENDQAGNIEACGSNVDFTKTLLSHNFRSLVRILNISTVDVYEATNERLSESSPIRPVSLYGSSKLYCEDMVKAFSETSGVSYINLRVGHVYGPGEEKYKKVLPLAIKNILTGKPVELWGDGSDLRSFIFINDVVESIMNALTLSKNNIDINITSGNEVSILELLQILKSVSSKSMTIMNRDSSHTKRDLIFDNSYLLETVLQKETDLQHGLKIEYEYMKSKYENNI